MWFKVDDTFATHPKVDALGDDQALALACWLLCGVACARDLTDGVVTPGAFARSLGTWPTKDRVRAAAALVRVGLWTERAEGGWTFHQWTAQQPTAAVVKDRREATRQRKAKFDERKRNESFGAQSERGGNALPTRPAERASDSPPTRPDPTRPEERESDARTVETEGEPIPVSTWIPARPRGAPGVRGRWASAAFNAVNEHWRSKGIPCPDRDARDPFHSTWSAIGDYLAERAELKGWGDEAGTMAEKAKGLVERFYAATDARTAAANHALAYLAKRPGDYTGDARRPT